MNNVILESPVNYDQIEERIQKMSQYIPLNSKSEVVVMLHIKQINELWKYNTGYYISTDFSEIVDQRKYLNVRERLLYNLPLEKNNRPPKIEIDKLNYDVEVVRFADGRNRFSNLRDLGFDMIPILISKRDLKKLYTMIENNQ